MGAVEIRSTLSELRALTGPRRGRAPARGEQGGHARLRVAETAGNSRRAKEPWRGEGGVFALGRSRRAGTVMAAAAAGRRAAPAGLLSAERTGQGSRSELPPIVLPPFQVGGGIGGTDRT